ncbi:MAG: hypothetical protein KFF72_01365 [Arthrospira sp. SH-MAG29]|nr:hypothetical protein [Arthrospira sp. SH-MAG29]MBS0015014.1 hypothetical protein [Arthrospira sp. SH-MAG29]
MTSSPTTPLLRFSQCRAIGDRLRVIATLPPENIVGCSPVKKKFSQFLDDLIFFNLE